VFARAEFKGPNDLKGATMAISAPNATPDMIGKAYMAQNNVPVSEVKFASLGNDPERYKAMLSGIALANRHLDRVRADRQERTVSSSSRAAATCCPSTCGSAPMTTGKLIAARRADVIGFLTAQMQGYRHALANREEELRITREITGIKADDPRPEFIFAEAARRDTGIDPTMPIAMDKLEWLQEFLVKAGNLAQPFDLGRMINADIRTQALRPRRHVGPNGRQPK
jgi:ABC-type nitrate/sulfonate/bicarbonate transport system substrate-binding protein